MLDAEWILADDQPADVVDRADDALGLPLECGLTPTVEPGLVGFDLDEDPVTHIGVHDQAGDSRDLHGCTFCFYHERMRGSSRSRRPSPSKLAARTVIAIARPGNNPIQIATRMNWRPSASITPHSGVGDCGPRPRKLSAAPVKIAPPMPMDDMTMIGATTFGKMCPNIIRRPLIPSTRAASIYICSRVSSTEPRTIRV